MHRGVARFLTDQSLVDVSGILGVAVLWMGLGDGTLYGQPALSEGREQSSHPGATGARSKSAWKVFWSCCEARKSNVSFVFCAVLGRNLKRRISI